MSSNYSDAIIKLKLSHQHLIFSEYPDECKEILERNSFVHSNYYFEIRHFVNIISEKSGNGLDKEENIKQLFVRTDSCFLIYHQNDIRSFWATKFVEEFCGHGLEEILDAFDFINGMNQYQNSSAIHNNNILSHDELKKIFDTFCIVILAKIFCIFDFFEKMAKEIGAEVGSTESEVIFSSIPIIITQFGLKKGKYHNKEISFVLAKSPNSTLHRKILHIVWSWYSEYFNQLFSKNSDELLNSIVDRPEICACIYNVRSRKSTPTNIDIDKIFKNLSRERNFFYYCALVSDKTKDIKKKVKYNFCINNTIKPNQKLIIIV